jgi:hypothetical protein
MENMGGSCYSRDGGNEDPYFIWNDSPTGTHWVAVYVDQRRRTAYVFNPMGLPLDEPVVEALKDPCCDIKTIISNDAPVQASDSETCGHWCLFFLQRMKAKCSQGSTSTAYKSIVNSLGVDDYGSNERFISNWWQRINAK